MREVIHLASVVSERNVWLSFTTSVGLAMMCMMLRSIPVAAINPLGGKVILQIITGADIVQKTLDVGGEGNCNFDPKVGLQVGPQFLQLYEAKED